MSLKKKNLLNLASIVNLRTEATNNKYLEFIEINKKNNCIYCDKELFVREFQYWVILENRFPYDQIAELSHMLSPKRHVAREEDFTEEERLELLQIKETEMGDYDLILESTQNTKSRPEHFHLHLLRYYRK